jgi:hypothetical protein
MPAMRERRAGAWEQREIQSYQIGSRETLWYDFGQEPYKPAYLARPEIKCDRAVSKMRAAMGWASCAAFAEPQRINRLGYPTGKLLIVLTGFFARRNHSIFNRLSRVHKS